MDKFEYDMIKAYSEYDKKTTKTTKYGINALELLTIAFVVLKLCKVITWSWWWVLSPIWISWGLAIIIFIVIAIINHK